MAHDKKRKQAPERQGWNHTQIDRRNGIRLRSPVFDQVLGDRRLSDFEATITISPSRAAKRNGSAVAHAIPSRLVLRLIGVFTRYRPPRVASACATISAELSADVLPRLDASFDDLPLVHSDPHDAGRIPNTISSRDRLDSSNIGRAFKSGEGRGLTGISSAVGYFSEELLTSTKVVVIERVPMPPLSSMGLSRFAEFEHGDYEGVTYLDTFFLKRRSSSAEPLHFHELIHVVQWR